MIEAAALIVFPVLMAFAASSDLLTMTISNRISIALVACFLAMALALHMPWREFADHLSCGVVILAITFALFWRGWVGGGDAKLAAATAVWLGWAHVMDYGLVASAFGGVLTLSILVLRRWPLPQWLARRRWAARLHEHGSGVPYGIALAAAGLFIYPDTQIWLRVIGA
jgi:prepilin peptidase CpaA